MGDFHVPERFLYLKCIPPSGTIGIGSTLIFHQNSRESFTGVSLEI
jgi:hypothetical protein